MNPVMREHLWPLLAHMMEDEDIGPVQAAEAVMSELSDTQLRELALPAIKVYARMIHRSQQRKGERDAAAMVEDYKVPINEARSMLADNTFPLPGGVRVKWLEATADQHLKRARMLRAIAAGTIATADQHETAAKDIRKAGVKCLQDLSQQEVAA